jgi:hypothetical protein
MNFGAFHFPTAIVTALVILAIGGVVWLIVRAGNTAR